jgi:hypothetical protein
MILYGLLGAILFIIIAAAAGSRDARKKAIDAGNRIKLMESKYEDYIEAHITNYILEENGLEVDGEELSKDVLRVIRPDLDGLISLINSTIYSSVVMNYSASYFPNLVTLTEEYFRQSQKNKYKRLTKAEEETFRNSALDAVKADIQKRLLDLKIGDL